MSKPLLLAGLVFLALRVPAAADTLDVQVFPLSGEIQLHNPNAFAVPFIFYSIKSVTNHVSALNPTLPQWQSITDFYDASGNGFIDPTHEWSKVSSTSIELTEGLFAGPGTFGSLPALRSVSLGTIWNPGVVAYTDLAFDIEQQTQAVTTNIQLALAGDYNHSGTVTQADYAIWRQNFGSSSVLDADGNLNGVVDAADYLIWRKNLNKTLPAGAGSSAGGGQSPGLVGSAVPEPTASVLIGVAGPVFLLRARRRQVA